MHTIRILCLRVLFLILICGLSATCFYLPYSVSYIYRLTLTITHENNFMKVEIHNALNSDICINTHFKNTLTNYTKSDILIKRLVLLPVDWDNNG